MSFYEMKKALVALLAAVFVLCAALSFALWMPAGMASAETVDHAGHAHWTQIAADGGTLSGGDYYLSGDVTLTENLTIGGAVTLCLNGHMLKGNGSGSVITVNGGANFTLCDCAGGGIVTGGSAANGGGVYVGGGIFTVTGGEIAGNTATTSGGGVYAGGAAMNVSGAPVIQDNAVGGAANNVCLPNNRVMTVTGALKDGARIGVDAAGNFAYGFLTHNPGADPADFFIPDRGEDYIAEAVENGAVSLVHKYYTVIYVDLKGGETSVRYDLGGPIRFPAVHSIEMSMRGGWTTEKGGKAIVYGGEQTVETGIGDAHGQVIYLYAVTERDLESDVASIQSQLTDIGSEIMALQAQLGEADTNIAGLVQSLNGLNNSLTTVRGQLGILGTTDASLQNQLTALQERLRELTDQTIASLQEDVKQLKNDLAEASESVSANVGNIEKLQTALDTVNAALGALDETYATDTQLQAAIDGMSVSLTEAVAEAKGLLQASIDGVQDKLDQAVSDLGEAIAEASGGNAAALEETVRSLTAAYGAADALIRTDFTAADGELSARIDALQGALDAADAGLQASIDGVQADLDKAAADLNASIAAGFADVADKLAAMEEAYQAADALIRIDFAAADGALSARIDALQGALDAADAGLQASIDGVQADLDKAVADLNASIAAASADVADKLAAMEEAYQAADALIRTDFAAADSKLSESIGALDAAYKAADAAVWAAVEALQADVGDLNGQIEALQGADGAIVWGLSALTAASIVIGAVGLILAIRAGKKR